MKNKRAIRFVCGLFFILSLAVFLVSSPLALPQNKVYLIELDDATINPVTAKYITEGIDKATQDQAECLIIKMDTPGGLLTSTREIVKKMLVSDVPIVVYIAPSGSRAGSAGVFITYASNIAVMAPSTNIGAAHPIQMNQGPKQNNDWTEIKKLLEDIKAGQTKENDNQAETDSNAKELKKRKETSKQTESSKDVKESTAHPVTDINDLKPDQNALESKMLQDTLAFIKAIAKERGRNEEWAVESVAHSSSVTSEEALDKGIIDYIAKDDRELLDLIDGKEVKTHKGLVTLKTKDADIVKIPMSAHQQFFNILADPNIAYILMILGFYGLLFEVTHPGFGLPGILGSIFLILAFYSLSTLPISYAGLALFALGLVFLVSEAFVPGFGLFTAGGLACMVLGSLMLFDSVDPIMRVSKSIIMAFSVLTCLITILLLTLMLRSRRRKKMGGKDGLLGMVGEARTALTPGKKGKVYVRGEIWTAVCDETVAPEEEIEVENLNGLILKVKKIKKL